MFSKHRKEKKEIEQNWPLTLRNVHIKLPGSTCYFPRSFLHSLEKLKEGTKRIIVHTRVISKFNFQMGYSVLYTYGTCITTEDQNISKNSALAEIQQSLKVSKIQQINVIF